jgi:hypothetical protein
MNPKANISNLTPKRQCIPPKRARGACLMGHRARSKKKFVGANFISWERILFRGNEFKFVGTNLNSWERIFISWERILFRGNEFKFRGNEF